MKLRAEITIDIDAGDYVTAGVHQTRIQQLVEDLRSSYPGAMLTFRERRTRGAILRPLAPTHRPTGKLHAYAGLDEDA